MDEQELRKIRDQDPSWLPKKADWPILRPDRDEYWGLVEVAEAERAFFIAKCQELASALLDAYAQAQDADY